MWQYNYLNYSDAPTENDILHYGKLGMKWGIRKASNVMAKNYSILKKTNKFDAKAEKLSGKSEKIHAKKDLNKVNKAAKKANKFGNKSLAIEKKMLNTTDPEKIKSLAEKSAKYKYKQASKQIDAYRIAKTTGYGHKAMKYSIKSDKCNKKAEYARLALAKNERYVSALNRKMATVKKHGKSKTAYGVVS